MRLAQVIAAASAMLALDAAWIFTNIGRYSSWLKRVVFAERVDWIAALLSYFVLFFVGFLGLAVPMIKSHLESGPSWWVAFRWSGAMGFVAYATFNLVNKALFANYPWAMVVIDTAWGTALYTILGAFVVQSRMVWHVSNMAAQ